MALTIAGSDSGGGAGIQADLKTFHAFGVFGCSAVTAVTAQNTLGVDAVHAIPEGVVRRVRVTVEGLSAKGVIFREHRYYGLNGAVLVVPACDLLLATGAPVYKVEIRVVEMSSPNTQSTFLSGLLEMVRVATTSIDLSKKDIGDATGLYIEAF